MSDTLTVLGELADLLSPAQIEKITEHMRAISSAIIPILVYLEMAGAHQESWKLQVDLIEESVKNPPPWSESEEIRWSPVIDAWLKAHDAKLLIAPSSHMSTNAQGELVVDQIGELALFPADTPGEQGQPQVPLDIRNQWAYAQGQFDALLDRRNGQTADQAQLKHLIAEQAEKHTFGYARTELANWQAYHAGERESYLAEIRADYLAGYLSAWPIEDGGAAHA